MPQWWSRGPAADLFNVIHLFGTICRKDKRWVLSHHYIILNPNSEPSELLWGISVVLWDINAWFNCDHHSRLQREWPRHVWSVMDIHPEVMANMMRAVFSSSLEGAFLAGLCDAQILKLLSYQRQHHAVDVLQARPRGTQSQTSSLDFQNSFIELCLRGGESKHRKTKESELCIQ